MQLSCGLPLKEWPLIFTSVTLRKSKLFNKSFCSTYIPSKSILFFASKEIKEFILNEAYDE